MLVMDFMIDPFRRLIKGKAMPLFICKTCGTQYPDSAEPPAACLICEDETQYIGWDGQHWTTLEELLTDHHTAIKEEEPDLIGIGMEPAFAINQRALLVKTPGGNVLWDCMTILDQAAIDAIKAQGGARAMAISHPHYYSAMIEWSRAFDNMPIYVHAAERRFVARPDPCLHFWEGDSLDLGGGLTVIRCGGHFEGSSVLHWPAGAEGRGVLLSGDTIYVAQDRRYVTFMRSFPNYLPLPARTVQRIVDMVEPFAYDRIYSAWWGRKLMQGAKARVHLSAERYIKAISE
jgi:glyoxylase-like metal-dependent hydrolase (beta-lactamase superfamily II)